MKKILFLLLATVAMYGQVPADATPLENIQITNNTTDNSATKVNVQSTDGTINTISKSDLVNVVEVNDVPSLPLVGEVGKIYVVKNLNKIYRWNGTFYQELAGSDISGKEDIANKQNSLSVDGSNTKYPTVTAVNTGLGLKANLASPSLTGTPTAPTAAAGANTTQVATTAFVTGADSQNVKLTGNQTISGQKSFSLTGKIDMQTNNAFPAIIATSLGSNGKSAAVFINDSSSPNSKALILQTGLYGGVGNMALDVLNTSPIGTGIFSNASNGGVSISSESHNGDSYISNITSGGTGRNYVGRNNGTETYSVDKTGNVIGNSYIKRSTPATNILLAGGGDLAQGTAFNKNFGTTAGTVAEGNDSRINNGQTAFGWGNHAGMYLPLTATASNSTLWGGLDANFTGVGSELELMIGRESISGTATSYTSAAVKSWLGLGSNAYTSTAYLPLSGGTLNGNLIITGALNGITFDNPIGQSSGITQSSSGSPVWNINKGAGDSSENYNIYNFTRGKIDFSISNSNGGITASPATLDTQLATLGQVKGSRPYKVYTALLSQSGTNAPTAVVLENTLGGTVVWTRTSTGSYSGTLTGVFTANKTFCTTTIGMYLSGGSNSIGLVRNSVDNVFLFTNRGIAGTDEILNNASIEIRVYPSL